VKILFDLEPLQSANDLSFDGGAEYTKTIVDKLFEQNIKNKRLLFCKNPQKVIDKQILDRILNNGYIVFDKANNRELSQLITRNGIDRFYSAIPYRYYDVDFGETQVIMTIHGLRALELPTDRNEIKYARLTGDYIKSILKRCFRRIYYRKLYQQYLRLFRVTEKLQLIAVSNHTKYALINYFPGLKGENIIVLYSPPKRYHNPEIPAFWQSLEVNTKEYFLMINGERWTKNIYRAVLAFDDLFSDFKEIDKKVIVTGTDNPGFVRNIKNRNRFKFLGYISDSGLEYLYQNAFAFVFPTLNEGFGYPPLECMKYGVPVLASAITSVPEVCGNVPLYFSPYSLSELKNRILNLLFDETLYVRKAREGIEHAQAWHVLQEKHLEELINLIIKK